MFFSDHVLICLQLKCNVSCNLNDSRLNDRPHGIKMAWKEDKKEEFCNALSGEECVNNLLSILSTLEGENVNERDINRCVAELK